MTARRISISRDGTVRLNGQATRWRVRSDPTRMRRWGVIRPDGTCVRSDWVRAPARAYLAALTDEELRG